MRDRLRRSLRRLQMEWLEPRQLLCGATACISELMAANNSSLFDFQGDASDWLELHNPTDQTIDLSGWYLTDKTTNLTKWQFPNVPVSVLSPGDYLVVFASEKSGLPGIPIDELHTNFKLSQDGEYTALVMPDGVTVAAEFTPQFPPQLDDVSYGFVENSAVEDVLVGEESFARLKVPADGSLGSAWQGGSEPFDDSHWLAGDLGVGFDTTTSAMPFATLDMGAIGQRLEASAVGVSRTGNGVNFPTTTFDSLAGDSFQVTIDNRDASGSAVGNLDWRDRGNGSASPLIALAEDLVKNNAGIVRVRLGGLPAGVYEVTSHHIDADFSQSEEIRVYVTDAFGQNALQADTGNANFVAGGVGGLTTELVTQSQAVFHVVSDGVGDVQIIFDGRAAADTEVPLNGLALRRGGSSYEGLINLDVLTQMFGISRSAYIRVPFVVEDPLDYTSLVLAMNYDDGFAAYLNGTLVAQRNAPAVLAYDSAAAAAHPDENALQAEVIDISSHLPLLVPGDNLLALHGLDAEDGEEDFLIVPRLTGQRVLPLEANYFVTPTPGAANVPGALGLVDDTGFSVDRGFYDEPQRVAISTSTIGAQIRYTLDGTAPTATSGTPYTDPLLIDSTTTLRAAAFKPGYLPSNVDTHTYLFLGDVLQQSESFGADGGGLPPFPAWGSAGENGDWEVDPEIVNHPDTSNRLTASDLRAVPTLSLVLPWEEMFGGGGRGIYIQGEDVVRAVSVEQILPDGSTGFQQNAGVEIVGGSSTNRWKSDKLSMRLKFTRDFGRPKLNSPIFGPEASDALDTIVLDATLNFSWTHPQTSQTDFAKFIQDQHTANLHNATGGFSPHATYHHLYINGLYWGIYYVHERPDDSFAATYLGGNKEDYDVIKHSAGNVVSGSATHYNAMLALARQNLTDSANYQNLAQVLDIDGFIDYMLVNFYIGNTDWAHQNWYASFNRVAPDGKWRYHSWDAEKGHTDVTVNVTDLFNTGGPTEVHQQLRANAEYRLRFADRVQKHFFHDGAMSPAQAAAAYQQLMDEIDRAVVGESARWGDNRVEPAYTRDDWLAEQNRLLARYFPARTSNVLSQLRDDDLFPASSVAAPEFLIGGTPQHGGEIALGAALTFSAPAGTVYYTRDGSDPRLPGGAVSPSAMVVTGPVALDATSRVRARLRTASGAWSALNEAHFFVEQLASPANLAITEVNYHPYAPTAAEFAWNPLLESSDFEFLELTNVGHETVNLAGVAITAGFQFQFDASSDRLLSPGERLLLVNNLAAFQQRYGTELNVAGVFQSGRLDDAGELIRGRDYFGNLLFDFAYDDSGAWPGRADGTGATLELVTVGGDYGQAASWRASNEYGGSPGAEGTGPIWDVVVNELLSHSEGAAPDWIELRNLTSQPIDLSGWYISDRSSDLFRTTIPAGTMIGPQGYVVLSQDQLGFGLSARDGDDVWLIQADAGTGRPLRFADHAKFAAADAGVTLGRWPHEDPVGRPFISMASATSGAANSGPVPDTLRFTELFYNAGWFRQDFTGDSTAGLTVRAGHGMAVDHSYHLASVNGSDALATLAVGGSLPAATRVEATVRAPSAVGAAANAAVVFDYQGPLDFKFAMVDLDAGRWRLGARTPGGWQYLAEAAQQLDRNQNYSLEVVLSGSVARLLAGGVEKTAYDFNVSLTDGNLGIASQGGEATFDELSVEPVDEAHFEFVEVYNATRHVMDVSLWKLAGGADYLFPLGTVIPRREAVVLVGFDIQDAGLVDQFRSRMGIGSDVRLLGGYSGRLDNAGDALRLMRPLEAGSSDRGYVVVDQLSYEDEDPWPEAADGQGRSLALRSRTQYGDLAESWTAAAPSPGSFRPAKEWPLIGVDRPLDPLAAISFSAVRPEPLAAAVPHDAAESSAGPEGTSGAMLPWLLARRAAASSYGEPSQGCCRRHEAAVDRLLALDQIGESWGAWGALR